jgi:hypothetical protein
MRNALALQLLEQSLPLDVRQAEVHLAKRGSTP